MDQRKISLKHHNNYCLFHQENLHCRISVDKFDHLQKLQNLSNYSMKTNGNMNRWALAEQTCLPDSFFMQTKCSGTLTILQLLPNFLFLFFSGRGASSQEAVNDFLSLLTFSVRLKSYPYLGDLLDQMIAELESFQSIPFTLCIYTQKH